MFLIPIAFSLLLSLLDHIFNSAPYFCLDLICMLSILRFNFRQVSHTKFSGATQVWQFFLRLFAFLSCFSLYIVIHSFSSCSFFDLSTFLKTEELFKTIIDVAKLIGIGSFVILTIIQALKNTTLGIHNVEIMNEQLYGCNYIIILHFLLTILCIAFATLKFFYPAITAFTLIICDSIMLGYVFFLLVFSPGRCQELAQEVWRNELEKKRAEIIAGSKSTSSWLSYEHAITNLSEQFISSNNSQYREISTILVDEINSLCKFCFEPYDTFFDSNPSFRGISAKSWTELLNAKTKDARRSILQSFGISCNDNLEASLDEFLDKFLDNIQWLITISSSMWLSLLSNKNHDAQEKVVYEFSSVLNEKECSALTSLAIYSGFIFAYLKMEIISSQSYSKALFHCERVLFHENLVNNASGKNAMQNILSVVFWLSLLAGEIQGDILRSRSLLIHSTTSDHQQEALIFILLQNICADNNIYLINTRNDYNKYFPKSVSSVYCKRKKVSHEQIKSYSI